jgi:hypothetical protein
MSCGTLTQFIHKPRARSREMFDSRLKIVNAKSDVMQAGAALVDEPGNCGIVTGGFQQLDSWGILSGARGKHGDIDAFPGYVFAAGQGHAEQPLVKEEAFVDIANCDSKMVDFNGHFARS